MALFLSAARTKQLQDELLAGRHVRRDTPCVVAYAATWPDELVFECRLGELAAKVKEHKLCKHTLVLVGPALGRRRHALAPLPPGPLPRAPQGRGPRHARAELAGARQRAPEAARLT